MMEGFYDPDALITTERLVLRPLAETDGHDMFRLIYHDREVLRYYVAPYVEEEKNFSLSGMIARCRKSGLYAFAVVLKDSGKVIGMLNLCSSPNDVFRSAEIGYAIGKEYWNRGYATEALKAFTQFLFEKGAHKVFCCHFPENPASGRVMQKAGMLYEGVRVSDIYYRGQYWDTVHYYLLNPADEV